MDFGKIGDFFTGGGEYADPTKIDPVYGVPRGMVRDAQWNTIGNISSTLLAAGMRMTPAQRAQILMQGLGNAGSRQTTDMYNAQLMRAKGDEVRQQATERQRQAQVLETIRLNPQAYGMTPEQAKLLGPSNVADIVKKQLDGEDLKSVDLGDRIAFVDSSGKVRREMQKAEKPLSGFGTIGVDEYGNEIKGSYRIGPNGVEVSPARPAGGAGAAAGGSASSASSAGSPSGPVVETVDGRRITIPPGTNAKVFRDELTKQGAQAVFSAPKAFDNLTNAYRNIEDLEKQPGLGGFFGATGLAGSVTSQIRGTDAYKAQARIDELLGSTFLQAYETLKGGGAITEMEGQKAQAAISRLGKPGVGEEDYRAAIRDFKAAVVSGMSKLKQVRGMDDPRFTVPAAPQPNAAASPGAAPSRADLEAEMRRRGLMK